MYRLPAELYPVVTRFLQAAISTCGNLVRLDVQDTDLSLEVSLVDAINNHPTLQRATFQNLRQLVHLPVDYCANTSFDRIHVQGVYLDAGQLPFPDGVLVALCGRPSSSPHVYTLKVGWFPTDEWVPLTFNSLQTMDAERMDNVRLQDYGGFFERHRNSLRSIQLTGQALKHHETLRNMPCLGALYMKVDQASLNGAFHVDLVHATRGEASRLPGTEEECDSWSLKLWQFTIIQETERTLEFMLVNLPPCEKLHFQRLRQHDEDGIHIAADASSEISQVSKRTHTVICCPHANNRIRIASLLSGI